MTITQIREEVATCFLREPSKSRRMQKACEVLTDIDMKRPFCYVSKNMDVVEVFQLPKAVTSPALDDIIREVEKNPDGMWYYYDGKTEIQRVAYDSIRVSFIQLREKCFGV